MVAPTSRGPGVTASALTDTIVKAARLGSTLRGSSTGDDEITCSWSAKGMRDMED